MFKQFAGIWIERRTKINRQENASPIKYVLQPYYKMINTRIYWKHHDLNVLFYKSFKAALG